MMTAEGCLKLHDLRRAHDEENTEIGKAIENFFAICEIAKKEFIEKSDWVLSNIQKLQARRETLHREFMDRQKEIEENYKEETA